MVSVFEGVISSADRVRREPNGGMNSERLYSSFVRAANFLSNGTDNSMTCHSPSITFQPLEPTVNLNTRAHTTSTFLGLRRLETAFSSPSFSHF
jgi:hypothetical protein